MQSVCNVNVKLVHAYVCKMYMIVCTLLMYSVCRAYAMLKVKLECACVCMCTIVCTLFIYEKNGPIDISSILSILSPIRASSNSLSDVDSCEIILVYDFPMIPLYHPNIVVPFHNIITAKSQDKSIEPIVQVPQGFAWVGT